MQAIPPQAKANTKFPPGQAFQQLPQELIIGIQSNQIIWRINTTGGGGVQQASGQQQQLG